MSRIIENIVYQHAENACALMWQWQLALHEPHYHYHDLRALEKRISANLDGLLIAGDAALPFIQELQEAGDEGAVFVMAMHALRKGAKDTFMGLVDACDQQQARGELAAALAWVSERHLKGIVVQLLESSGPEHQVLGLSACLAHRRNPGKYLKQSLSHENTMVRRAALHAVANLADSNLLSSLPTTSDLDPLEHVELARALLSLGEYEKGNAILETLAQDNVAATADATRLLLLSAPTAKARSFLKQLDTRAGRQRDVVRGFGLLGDPRAIEWLIQQCKDASLARLAGESISMITGVRLADSDLALDEPPENAESTLNDDPADDNVQMEEDENLDWPNAAALAAWWQAADNKLISGTPHICGHIRSPESLRHVLHHGLQRQRGVAADLLLIRQTGNRYCDTRLPTHQQRHFMTEVGG